MGEGGINSQENVANSLSLEESSASNVRNDATGSKGGSAPNSPNESSNRTSEEKKEDRRPKFLEQIPSDKSEKAATVQKAESNSSVVKAAGSQASGAPLLGMGKVMSGVKNGMANLLSMDSSGDEKEFTGHYDFIVTLDYKGEYIEPFHYDRKKKDALLKSECAKTSEADPQDYEIVMIELHNCAHLGRADWDDPPDDGFPITCYYAAIDRAALTPLGKLRKHCLKIVESKMFDAVIGVVIMTNAVTIGVEIQQKVHCKLPDEVWNKAPEDRDSIVDEEYAKCTIIIFWFEIFFTIVYTVEACMQLFSKGWDALKSNWIKADICFVCLGYLDYLLKAFLSGAPSVFKQLKLLRSLRLLRLARPLRLLYKFKALWTLVSGLMQSASTIMYTTILLVVIIYIAACLAVELIAKTTQADAAAGKPRSATFVETQELYFPVKGALTNAMLTLFSFVAMDSVAGIYRPLIENSPNHMDGVLLTLFFVLVICIIAIVLMNIITAVIIDNALSQSDKNQAERRKKEQDEEEKLLIELRELFIVEVDTDGSKHVGFEEMENALVHESWNLFLTQRLNMNVEELFAELDLDRDKEYHIDHFIDAIKHYVLHPGPPPVRRLERDTMRICHKMGEIEDIMTELSQIAVRQTHNRFHGYRKELSGFRELQRKEVLSQSPKAVSTPTGESSRNFALEPQSPAVAALMPPLAGAGPNEAEEQARLQHEAEEQARLEVEPQETERRQDKISHYSSKGVGSQSNDSFYQNRTFSDDMDEKKSIEVRITESTKPTKTGKKVMKSAKAAQ